MYNTNDSHPTTAPSCILRKENMPGIGLVTIFDSVDSLDAWESVVGKFTDRGTVVEHMEDSYGNPVAYVRGWGRK